MTTKPTEQTEPAQPAQPAKPAKPAKPGVQAPISPFEMCFTSTPRGARLARRLAAVQLDRWGIPYDTDPHDAIVLIVGELAANAVRHGRVPGRDFQLRLHAAPDARTVRVEVTDTRAERLPRCPALPEGVVGVEEAGRGLLIVSQLANRWDWHPRSDGPGKVVWAEYVKSPVPQGS